MPSKFAEASAFLADHGTYIFNWVLALALWAGLGLPLIVNYGYDDNSRNDDYTMVSGPQGSGAFPVLTFLFCVSTVVLGSHAYSALHEVSSED